MVQRKRPNNPKAMIIRSDQVINHAMQGKEGRPT